MRTHSSLSRARGLIRRLLPVALVAGTLVVATPPASAAGGWAVSKNPSPLGPTGGALYGVACASATNCFAVGTATTTLLEHWDGTHWSIVASPHLDFAVLNAVTCPSASSCFAVGSYETGSATQTLVEHWNGTSWTIMASANSPAPSYDVLVDIVCPGPNTCYAVGDHATGTTHFTLIEHWDGTTWSIMASPNPASASASYLAGVRCPLSTTCVAVGYYETPTATKTLAEQWNGTSWSVVQTGNAITSSASVLSGIACPNSTTCFAVGNSGDTSGRKTLLERWNGTKWSIMAGFNFDETQSHLSAVKCLSPTNCFVVGARGDNTLIEHWNGTHWSLVSSPNAERFPASELGAISCVSALSCEAVGDSDSATLVEHWNGTSWLISAPALGSSQSQLADVACPNTANCTAVGSYFDGSTTKTLVERWNGTGWSTAGSTNPGGGSQSASLAGVSCASATNCFAVGSFTTATFVNKSLVEHWDGTTWSIVPSPNPSGATGTYLADVACSTTAKCDAVGSYTSASASSTFVLHWNGTTWTIAPNSPPPGTAALSGVSCPGPTSCNEVGYVNGVGGNRTLIEHWNGSSWHTITSPTPAGTTNAALNGVACTAANSCDAVGTYSITARGEDASTLVDHWNGTGWTIVATPNPSGRGELDGIACASSSACYAVGTNDTGTVQPFSEQWDGTSWSIVPMPDPIGAVGALLPGAACPTTTNCFAVGTKYTHIGTYALVERHT